MEIKDRELARMDTNKQEEINRVMSQRDDYADGYQREREECETVKRQYDRLGQECDDYKQRLQKAEQYLELCEQKERE